MELSKKFREWLIKNCGVAADATDDECRKAAGEAFANGKLTPADYAALTKSVDQDNANRFATKLDQIADSLSKLAEGLTTKAEESDKEPEKAKEPDKALEKAKEPEQVKQPSRLAKMISGIGMVDEVDGKDIDIRVKGAVESYSSTKTAMLYPERTKRGSPHALAGQRATMYGRGLDTASDRNKALAGVWAKFQLMSVTPRLAGSAQRAWEMLNDHEKSLLAHLTDSEEWDNSRDGKPGTMRGYPGGIKALIDDATSGGLEAAPIVFDDQVIEIPLLFGELYPLVNVVPLDRGRRIEGVAVANVTGSWGGVDDTAVSLFSTSGYVSAFNTTVYRWEGAVKIGLDLISDSPLNFGQMITQQYGNALLEDLDDVIATGNGTTEPEGIVTKGGTSVAWGAATSLTNYESLRAAVTKPEHGALANTAVFCGTETSYFRAMGIPVGTTDVRRVFMGPAAATDYDGYSIMGRPYKINESLTNAQVFYAIMGRYRMYMRRGLAVRTTTEGDTLTRANEMLIVAMARYGGQLERNACAAVTTTAPT